MLKNQSRNKRRLTRFYRNGKIRGRQDRPRLNVFRSARHFYAQVIDDQEGKTLLSYSTLGKDLKGVAQKEKGLESATHLGEQLGKVCVEKGIKKLIFDRHGFKYHGRVKAFCDGVRKEGVQV